MSRKTSIIISITCIFIIIISLIGLTFGFYLTKVYGNENSKSIVIEAADSKLRFTDLSTANESIKMSLGQSFSKYFTVENIGEGSASYYVALINVANTFNRKEDVRYTLYRVGYNKDEETPQFPTDLTSCQTKVDDTFNTECVIVVDSNEFPASNSSISPAEVLPNIGQVYKYKLVITYVNQPTINQDADRDSYVTGKVQISASEELGGINVTNGTLAINYLTTDNISYVTNTLLEDRDIKGDALSYRFSVRNIGKTHQNVTIKLTDIQIDDALKTADFRWGLYNEDTGNGLSFGVFKYVVNNGEELIYTDTIIDAGEKKSNNYILRIWLHNDGSNKDSDPLTDQTPLLSKNFSANIEVTGESIEYTPESCFTLAKEIEGLDISDTYANITSPNTIVDYDESCGSDVIIPKIIKGVIPDTVGPGADNDYICDDLYNCKKVFENITSLIIPNTIRAFPEVSGNEFEDFSVSGSLEHLTIPENLNVVGYSVFKDLSVNSLFLPDNIYVLGGNFTGNVDVLFIHPGYGLNDAVGTFFQGTVKDIIVMDGVEYFDLYLMNFIGKTVEVPKSVFGTFDCSFDNEIEIIVRGKSSLDDFDYNFCEDVPDNVTITFRP